MIKKWIQREVAKQVEKILHMREVWQAVDAMRDYNQGTKKELVESLNKSINHINERIECLFEKQKEFDERTVQHTTVVEKFVEAIHAKIVGDK